MKSDYSPADLGPFHPNRDRADENEDFFDWRKADVWALGVIFYCMLFRVKPSWCHNHNVAGFQFDPEFQRICRCRGLATHPRSCTVSNNAIDLLQNILLEDPEERLSVDEILAHAWFVDENDI